MIEAGRAARSLLYSFVAVALAVLLAIGVGIASGVRFAPESRAQARKAEADPIWARAPSGMNEFFRHTGLEDATWLPSFLRQTTTSVIQRAYRFDTSSTAAFEQWHRAATSTGWTFAATFCSNLSETAVTYTKMLGEWPATMAVEGNLDEHEVAVVITIPDYTQPSASGELQILDCRSPTGPEQSRGTPVT